MTNPTAKMLAGVLVLLALIAASLYMVANNIDGSSILMLASPFVGYLIIGSKVDTVTGQQNDTLAEHSVALATITKQTNGVLTGRIKDAVHEALAQRDAAIAAGAVLATPDTTTLANVTTQPEPAPE